LSESKSSIIDSQVSTWPDMWRVVMPHGWRGDMTNLSRARQAAQDAAQAMLAARLAATDESQNRLSNFIVDS